MLNSSVAKVKSSHVSQSFPLAWSLNINSSTITGRCLKSMEFQYLIEMDWLCSFWIVWDGLGLFGMIQCLLVYLCAMDKQARHEIIEVTCCNRNTMIRRFANKKSHQMYSHTQAETRQTRHGSISKMICSMQHYATTLALNLFEASCSTDKQNRADSLSMVLTHHSASNRGAKIPNAHCKLYWKTKSHLSQKKIAKYSEVGMGQNLWIALNCHIWCYNMLSSIHQLFYRLIASIHHSFTIHSPPDLQGFTGYDIAYICFTHQVILHQTCSDPMAAAMAPPSAASTTWRRWAQWPLRHPSSWPDRVVKRAKPWSGAGQQNALENDRTWGKMMEMMENGDQHLPTI